MSALEAVTAKSRSRGSQEEAGGRDVKPYSLGWEEAHPLKIGDVGSTQNSGNSFPDVSSNRGDVHSK